MKLPLGDRRAEECTAVVCGKETTTNRKVLIGQTKDTDSPLDRYRIMRVAYQSGRRAILLNYPGWVAGHRYLTSDGLSVTGNSLYAARPKREEAIPMSLLFRLALEKRSVAEVLSDLPDGPLENGCFLMGDATGRKTVREVADQPYGHANNILSPELVALEAKKLLGPTSPYRQANVQRHLDEKRGAITSAELQRIFSDHTDFPNSICRHRVGGAKAGTTGAFVANLTDKEIDIAIGNPCVARFKRYSLDF